MSESNIGKKIMLSLSNLGSRLFRFNTALSWAGNVQRFPESRSVYVNPSDIIVRNARPIHSGFEGASDYIGWHPIVITDAMVGKTLAVFLAIETKSPGAKTAKDRLEKQQNFIDQVNKSGGIAFFADSEENAIISINILKDFLK